MSARVKPAVGSGWLAVCDDCDDSQWALGMAQAELWADAHNADKHRGSRMTYLIYVNGLLHNVTSRWDEHEAYANRLRDAGHDVTTREVNN